ncbi:unnamed protein product [Caenorhabditis bovis]|uniref:WD repeat-containing protein 54 beta-propeller domain-containing protein n=1 Tax=Caenorhabditis bovis TaxID=2654633 RepID=A0A8S1ELT2_9PELO|nr:unnamed protein product [Caenorhabditis bovis]
MFEHVADVTIPTGTVSPWLGNLAVCWLDTRNITYMGIIQGNNVHIGHWDNKTDGPVSWDTIHAVASSPNERSSEITALGIVHPNARNYPIVVVGTVSDIQIYDVRKCSSKVVFKISLETALKMELAMDINRDIGPFCRGVTCNDNTILVGTHSGEIVVIMCNGDSNFSTKRNLKEHTHPIADIATCRYDEITISGSANGEVIVWQKPVKGVQARIATKQHISVMNILRKQVIIGTMRGIVQLYSVATGALMCETTAHARVVTSISIAPESAYVLTASEDGVFIVSKLHTRKPHAYQLEYRFSKKDSNSAIVGAQFTNGRGSTLAIAAYDHPHISTFKIFKKSAAKSE